MAELEKRIYDGDQARLVLENEAFQQALDDTRKEIIDQWQKAPARDVEGREKLWQLLKLTDKLEAHLRSSLETGKLAKLELKHQETLAQRAKAAARSALGMS
jgi:preprotein translocase subunit SecA